MRAGALSAVELADVEKRFGSVRALAGVQLAVPPGCLVHVSGANGAGKSTLLRVIAGRTRPTRGSVRVQDRDPFRSSDAAVRVASTASTS